MHRQAMSERRCIIPVDTSSQDLLRSHCRGGNLIRPFPHMFADPEYWATLTRAERYRHILRSLCLRHPDWVICGPSAAVACDFSESHRLLRQVHVIDGDKNRHQPRHDYIRFHFRSTASPRMVDGIQVCPLINMLLDCALLLPFPDALAVWDAVAQTCRLTRDDFDRMLAGLNRIRGIRHAWILTEHVDGSSENAGESIARGVMLQGGLAVPELQVEFRDPLSGRTIRVDFLWRLPNGALVAGELDGRQKYVDTAMLKGGDTIDAVLREKNRDGNLSLLGIHTVHFTFAEVFNGTMVRKLTYAGVPVLARPRSALLWHPR